MLLEREIRLVDDLKAPQPLHVIDAFEARDDQAQREAVIRTYRFAILSVCHQHIVERFG